ncbi:LysR family transcriptional regulator [Streptomyces sp. SA15]|uniref:LysR family transcriptional regulator n=1 Tax=Streptomyces sp. SA15 TaxID=934019 RepID=UPI000BAFFC61|nr:LysR family transcriptional regulator [Streptomyces sp. SA15]PAZ12612.1 LysR family transcriptional regulator [Streptomyces sp. SA15]
MNLESVRAFIAVAEEGQFRHAASRLGLTQQAVSKRVAALESFLSVALFRRVPTGAVLTSHGESFLPHARAVLMAVRAAVASVRTAREPLRVDVLRSHLASAQMLRDFHLAHGEIPLETLTLANAAAALRALLDDEIDAAFAYLRAPVQEREPLLRSSLVRLEALQVVIGDEHPLAGAAYVRPEELSPYTAWVPGIVKDSEWGDYYRAFGEEFSVAIDPSGPNFGTGPLLEAISPSSSLITFVGEGTRLSWAGERKLHRIPMVSPTPVYPWSVVWHARNEHPALPELLAHVRAGFRPASEATVWTPHPQGARTE